MSPHPSSSVRGNPLGNSALTLRPQKVPSGEKIAYGLGDTATNLVWRTLMVFLPIFYTDVFGLSAAAVGTLLLICRYWDGITDFIMGLIADRTSTRWGKFRPWILWTAVPFGIFTVLTFTAMDLSATGKLIYAYATYSALIIAFTANNIPYSALTGVMTADPVERTSISSYRFFFAFLGGLLTLFSIVSVLLFLLTFLGTKERVRPVVAESHSSWEDVKDLFRNRSWFILFCIGLLFVTFTTLKQGVTMYYFKYFVGDTVLATAFMTSGLVAAMIGAAMTPWLSRTLGKRRLMSVSLAVGGVSSALLFLAGPSDFMFMFGLSMLTEFSTGPIVALFFAMLADASDFSEWQTGRRATGLTFSAGTLSFKFGTGVAGALTGWVLTTVGYVANTAQTAETLLGIRILISVVPGVVALLGLGIFQWYTLDESHLERIGTDLAERRRRHSEEHGAEGMT
jgi:GPH family glycoside/pentoside/hexuronide:cation symporter